MRRGLADETTQSVVCYECMTDSVPDMAVLGEELKVWKAYIAERELETAKLREAGGAGCL